MSVESPFALSPARCARRRALSVPPPTRAPGGGQGEVGIERRYSDSIDVSLENDGPVPSPALWSPWLPSLDS